MAITFFKHLFDNDLDEKEESIKRKAYRNWFVKSIPVSEFEGEEKLLFLYFKYVSIYRLKTTQSSVNSFIKTELRSCVIKHNLHLASTNGLNFADLGQLMSAVQITSEELVNIYEESTGSPEFFDDLIPAMLEVFEEKLASRTMAVLNEAPYYLEGSMANTKFVGANGMIDFIQTELKKLRTIYNKERIQKLAGDQIETKPFKLLSNFGLTPLDKITGGIFSTELISIESGPGVGKTKFCLGNIVWRSAVVFKQNVLYYSLEQTNTEIESLLVARHCHYMYNIVVDEACIRVEEKYNSLSQELRQDIESAKWDLFESGKYGKITLRYDTLYASSLEETLESENELNGFHEIVCIDYVGLIENDEFSRFADKEYLTIALSLKKLKKFARYTGCAIVAVNQLTGEGAEVVSKGGQLLPKHAQGGMIVYRSSDKNIVIWKTEEMSAQNRRGIKLTKARGSTDVFQEYMYANTSACLFYISINEIQIR